MRCIVVLASCLLFAQTLQADIIYLKGGEVHAGKVTRLDSTRFQVELSDGELLAFENSQIFRVIDDSGQVLFDGVQLKKAFESSPNLISEPEADLQQTSFPQSTGEYRKVMRFPFWPLLGGTAILGYVGVTQLIKSSDTYKESQNLEELGLEFNSTRDRSQKQRTWGQISIAGAAACLLVGLTPHYEKVPVQSSLRVTPTKDGITLSFNF